MVSAARERPPGVVCPVPPAVVWSLPLSARHGRQRYGAGHETPVRVANQGSDGWSLG